MKGMIGAILMIVGGCVMIGGIGLAVWPMVKMYRANLEDPMGQPDGAENRVKDDMLRGVFIGAAGAPFFLVGTVMVKAAVVRAMMRKRP